jgi:hypothetical protein
LRFAGARYQNTQARVALTEQLLDRIRSLPGVEHAAVGSLGPLSGGMMTGGYRVLGIDSDSARTAALRAVSADFFATLGVPVREGRTIGRGDGADAPLVVVVNQSFVRQAFAGRSPIGTALMLNAPGRDSTEAFRSSESLATRRKRISSLRVRRSFTSRTRKHPSRTRY